MVAYLDAYWLIFVLALSMMPVVAADAPHRHRPPAQVDIAPNGIGTQVDEPPNLALLLARTVLGRLQDRRARFRRARAARRRGSAMPATAPARRRWAKGRERQLVEGFRLARDSTRWSHRRWPTTTRSPRAGRRSSARCERINAVRGRQAPQVDARARAEYQQLNLDTLGISVPERASGFPRHPKFDLYTLGAGVSYDLDLWGKTRRALEQAVAEAEAQQRQTEAAHLLIAGRVTQQVLAIAALNDRIATEQTLLAEDERNLSLTKARFNGGVGTMVEVLSAEGQLASDRANLPPLEQQLAEARAMLAVLVGVSPAELGRPR